MSVLTGMYDSIVADTDSYKLSHWEQYPPDTKYICSYIEARGTDEPFLDEVVHFGLQIFLEYLANPVKKADVDWFEPIARAHGFNFNRKGWDKILNVYNGRLPLIIHALPEGMVVPLGIPQVQMHNTDPELPWITSYVETAILRSVWYPSTVATLSRSVKKTIKKFLDKTSDDPAGQLPFKLHDFGARGVSSKESAAIGGCAHLVNFMGTDTLSGLLAAQHFYGAEMPGYSIPAAEHSTITAWGGPTREIDAFRNMLEKFGGENKLVAVVSDSYDIYNAVDNIWGNELRDEVKATGGTLVIRPDSGNPVVVVKKILQSLERTYGTTINSKGFAVLDPHVRVIWGDGIDPNGIFDLLFHITEDGWSADNLVFGMGGGLLQKVNRDTLKYAMKANAIHRGNGWEDVWKKPIDDPTKASKRGRQAVIRENGVITSVPELQGEDLIIGGFLEPVFHNGKILKTWNFDEVRKNAELTE